MSETVKMTSGHLFELVKEPLNQYLEEWFTSGKVEDLEKGESFTFIYKDQIMLCGGITPYWTGRGQLWCVFSGKAHDRFVPCYRAIKKWIDDQLRRNFVRIEVSIDHGESFDLASRRAELLGFYIECPLARKYLPNGGDVALYAMVRHE